MSKQSTSFWNFSNQLYDRDDVSTACLHLQNEFQFDVNLLLFCCWAAHFDETLSPDSWDRILEFSRQWRKEVVQPLRDVRSWMKGESHHYIENTEFSVLRERIKMDELAAEKFQQEYMEKSVAEVPKQSSEFSAARAQDYFNKLARANSQEISEEISTQLQILIDAVEKITK
ncbi:MAG: TIGR02444 family protein [Gammaproteobacteria bacterium]|nr:TIGR02444 family protein [Gammaproteobacteria bacterium]MDD9957460.1 TIGR02444 family protein [Gammaproteobacteria bacterium]